MARLVAAIVVLFLSGTAFSQNEISAIDLNHRNILLKKLSQTTGREKVMTYNAIGDSYFFFDSLAAADYFEKGIQLAKKGGFRAEEIEIECNFAYLEGFYGNHFASLNRLMRVSRYNGLSKAQRGKLFALTANALEVLGANDLAIFYVKASMKMRSTEKLETYYKTEQLARMYSKIQRFDSANVYYKKALGLVGQTGSKGLLTHCLNNVGANYLEQGNLSAARHFFELGVSNFHLNVKYLGDSVMYAILLDNMAKVYDKSGEHRMALEKRRVVCDLVKYMHLPAGEKNLYGKFLLDLVENELRMSLLDDAKSHLDEINLKKLNPEDKVKYYDALATFFQKTGQFEQAFLALRKKCKTEESNSQDQLFRSGLDEFTRFRNYQIKQELIAQKKARERLAEINKKELALAIGSSIAILGIVIFVFVVYRKNQENKNRTTEIERKLNQEKLRFKESEAERLTLELELKNKDLLTFAINITKKYEFTGEIALRLQQLRKKSEIKKSDVTELITYVKSFQAVDDKSAVHQNNANEINNRFLLHLQEKYPQLTQNETELCLLIKLKLSSKDIASIKNITSESVNVLRSRLRKKMNLDPKDDLYTEIDKI